MCAIGSSARSMPSDSICTGGSGTTALTVGRMMPRPSGMSNERLPPARKYWLNEMPGATVPVVYDRDHPGLAAAQDTVPGLEEALLLPVALLLPGALVGARMLRRTRRRRKLTPPRRHPRVLAPTPVRR